jgi:P pilus assembly chaperone PapD
VTFQNTGNMHIQISKLELFDGQNKLLGVYNTPYYVLARQSREVLVPTSSAGGSVIKITASTDYQPLTSEVKVS